MQEQNMPLDKDYPYQYNELCHCRRIMTKEVDDAILSGASTVEQVKKITRAGTGCGTCILDIEKILEYRKKFFNSKVL